jgi:hypothetical protein
MELDGLIHQEFFVSVRSGKWISGLVLCAAAMLGSAARAGVCDAAFMHEGGAAQFTGQGPLTLSADLAFSEVAKQGSDQCRARVQGTASFVFLGFPTGRSKLDYLMTVKDGQASFVRYDKAGEKPSDNGRFDLRMLGLFAYDRVKEGQRLPGAAFRLNIGPDSPVGGQPSTTIRIGEKKVGAIKTLDTPVGSQSCWPVTYTRDTDPTMLNLKNLMLPIPGVSSTVTDWYCPKLNLVVRQDIVQPDARSSVVLTHIK